MLKHKKLLLFFFVIPAVAIVIALWYFHSIRIIRLDHEGFTLWLDCGRRGAVKFRYVAKADKGNLDRLHMFSFDPQVSADCQQTSTALYVYQGVHYDRGHLVPANHFDHSLKALKQTNYITNILPMTLEVPNSWRDSSSGVPMRCRSWDSQYRSDPDPAPCRESPMLRSSNCHAQSPL